MAKKLQISLKVDVVDLVQKYVEVIESLKELQLSMARFKAESNFIALKLRHLN